MKIHFQLFLILGLALSASGCATSINYGFDSKMYKREKPHAMTALVDEFQDLRTQDEHDGTFSATKDYLYTEDKQFNKNIGDQVTDTVVKHLRNAHLFNTVTKKDIPNFADGDIEAMQNIAKQGYDILVMGDLHHFYGYRSGKNAAMMGALFGLAGTLTEAVANKKTVGGRATLGDVKIVDLKNQKVLWQGNINYDFEKRDTFYSEPPGYAIEALKKVNEQLVQKIDELIQDK